MVVHGSRQAIAPVSCAAAETERRDQTGTRKQPRRTHVTAPTTKARASRGRMHHTWQLIARSRPEQHQTWTQQPPAAAIKAATGTKTASNLSANLRRGRRHARPVARAMRPATRLSIWALQRQRTTLNSCTTPQTKCCSEGARPHLRPRSSASPGSIDELQSWGPEAPKRLHGEGDNQALP